MKLNKRVKGTNQTQEQEGSVLVLAVFVTFLLSAMGVTLLFLSVNELKMNRAGLNVKKAFYLAESGLEDGRATLYNLNGSESLVDDLTVAAGVNDTVDFDPDKITVSYDADGNILGFAGYGDDVPLIPMTAFGEGAYIAFLTNDALEGVGNFAVDDNDRVMITGVGAGAGAGRAMEIVQAIVEIERIFPSYPPATITMLGPSPVLMGAKSTPKVYDGEDCGGNGNGIPDLWVPVIGVIGSDAVAGTEAEITPNPTYTSGDHDGVETFADLLDEDEPSVQTGNGIIADEWLDCEQLRTIVELVRSVADVICYDDSCVLPPNASDRVVFVDGDWVVGPSVNGQGLILVTGELEVHGGADWHGLMYAIGEGRFTRYGSGNGTISGATMTADIAGPDNIYGTADDCTGGENGYNPVVYDERGGGNSDTTYCTSDFLDLDLIRPYDVREFRQR